MWVVSCLPSEEILLFCAFYLRCKYYRYVSHSLSLSAKYLCETRDICLFVVVCVFVLLLFCSLKRERTLLLLIGIGFFRILSRGRLLWNRIVREEEEEEEQEQSLK